MPKKNLPSRQQSSNLSSLLSYTWPKLHSGKRWYVDLFAFDPSTQTMRRKKFYISDSLKQCEKKRRAAEIIGLLTEKLHQGWNPWVANGNSRQFVELEVVFDRYVDFISKTGRRKTIYSYTSRINVLKDYIKTLSLPIRYVYQFTPDFIVGFLDYIYLDRDCGARTRNNYRGWCSAFGEWLVERRYLEDNPAASISKVRETPKKRKDLTAEMLQEMNDHLLESDPHFLLACMFEYYTFIRPTELSHIRLCDISLLKQSVYVDGQFSKNKRSENVGLNAKIIKHMLDLGIFHYPSDYYLFGRNFRPSDSRVGPDQFNKRWVKMRQKLNWDDSCQFYSLKDTGIRDLANAAGIVIARDQARHTDVSTTNKYLRGRDQSVHDETKTFKGGLG